MLRSRNLEERRGEKGERRGVRRERGGREEGRWVEREARKGRGEGGALAC